MAMIALDYDAAPDQYIYCLIDPRTSGVRYIGCCTTPRNTKYRHQAISSGSTQRKLKAWVRELRELGLRPEFRVLQRVPWYLAHEMETHYIRSYKIEGGFDLLNERQLMTVEEGILRDNIAARRRIDRRTEASA